MITPDMINGCFELFGAFANSLNVKRLHKDKEIKGIHWASTLFFTSWGFWNIFFFPHMHLWFSFAGGITVVTVNIIWLIMLFYYRKNKNV